MPILRNVRGIPRVAVFIVGLGMVVASCTTGTAGTTTTTAASPSSTVPGSVRTQYPIDHGLDFFVDKAVDDLSARLSIEPASITVYNAYLVVWPDSSIGCPEPDKAYLPALYDGSIIDLEVDGKFYRYHTGGDSLDPHYCEKPSDDYQMVNETPLETTPDKGSVDSTVPPPAYND